MRDVLPPPSGAGVGYRRSSTRDADERFADPHRRASEAKPAKTFRFYPKVYKAAIAAANGSASYEEYSEKVRELEQQSPISMRHIMGLRRDRDPSTRATVDASIGHHDYPHRDLLDELRLAVRARLPGLCGGREGDQHPLHQRGGRRDPGHVRRVPQVARPAGRLGPLRRLGRDAQLLVRRRDQDRPGREARRGRPPAGPEGLREGRRGAQRVARAPT